MELVSDLVEMCICQGVTEGGGGLIHLVVMRRRMAGYTVRWREEALMRRSRGEGEGWRDGGGGGAEETEA